MECIVVCDKYPLCACGGEGEDYYDIADEEFLDQDELPDWFTEEE